MSPSPDSDPRALHAEETDPLWPLLDASPLPQPDPWFTARTLARCRNESASAASSVELLTRVWRWALGAGLGVSTALFLLVHLHPAAAPAAVTNQKSVQEAFEIMASMDPDADASTPATASSWQDSSSL